MLNSLLIAPPVETNSRVCERCLHQESADHVHFPTVLILKLIRPMSRTRIRNTHLLQDTMITPPSGYGFNPSSECHAQDRPVAPISPLARMF
jgi:hypothetical protein